MNLHIAYILLEELKNSRKKSVYTEGGFQKIILHLQKNNGHDDNNYR